MGWMSTLSKTYDNALKVVGDDSYDTVLLPQSYLTEEAQITVTIDCNGNFFGAEKIEKGSGTTIIPVTEASATRSNNPPPHPLCDKLIYTAGDYSMYVKTESKKDNEKEYNAYIKQLKKWKESEYSCEKVKAIYNYLSKKTLMRDLIKIKVLTLSSDGMLDKKVKIGEIKQPDWFVRFNVFNHDKSKYVSETWRDKELFDSFIKFNDNLVSKKSICYVTGKEAVIAVKHPAKIRDTGDKAKIISSNDEKKKNFVFKGRFISANEAVTVSYETTQKAHNALRWLIGNQGYRIGTNCIVSWSVKGEELPDVFENPASLFFITGEDGRNINTGQVFAQRLNKAIAGYYQKIDDSDNIAVMSVDTADGSKKGRLSIKYYNELTKQIYLENIRNWYSKCFWDLSYNNYKTDKIGTPPPKDIAMAAYGTERTEVGKKEEIKIIYTDEKVQKMCVDRLLPCIIEGRRFPKDIVLSAVRNASRPEAFSKNNHDKIIAVTCAAIKAHYKDKGVEVSMELNDSNDRSYLFGRLLAVADVLEQRTYDKSETGRVTNARRYWSVFAKKPAKTWAIIMTNLQPYIDKQEKYKFHYNKLFEDIHEKLNEVNGFNDKALSPDYVLGYWCQRKFMNTKNTKEET